MCAYLYIPAMLKIEINETLKYYEYHRILVSSSYILQDVHILTICSLLSQFSKMKIKVKNENIMNITEY